MNANTPEVRPATHADVDGILDLLPRLAAFDIPPERDGRDLWRHDAELLKQWRDGKTDNCLVHVACSGGQVAGVAITTLKPEALSEADGAHLEVLAVADGHEGQGLGRALIEAAETDAITAGATCMTLHVFARNERARALYERAGFDGELMRYIKRF